MSVPYASAISGQRAREEITKILRRFGCDEIGFYDAFDKHEVLLQFTHRGRPFQIRVSAKGWAQLYLKEKPWTPNRRASRADYEQAALKQGYVALNSILRDAVKAQVTAVECGIVSFKAVFMPYMVTADGRPVVERLAEINLLPAPEAAKVVPLK